MERGVLMYKIRCADVNDARVLGEIHWGLNELKNRGYNKVTLWVLEENLNARRFYEKIGFKHDGTTKEITLGKKLKELRYEIEIYPKG